MKQTINFNNFVEAFHSMGRSEQFSYDALKAIFEYLEDYERDSGEEQELDVISICCDFAESTPKELRQDYLIPNDVEIVDFLDDFGGWYELLDSGNIVYQSF